MLKKICFSLILVCMPCIAVAHDWIDTKNKSGPKIYLDKNSQYYYSTGQVYTIKYEKNGKTLYTQIELKDLNGHEAAILSISDVYMDVYYIPITIKYKELSPEQAIYNSAKMVLASKVKPYCPSKICVNNNMGIVTNFNTISDNIINSEQKKT